MTIDWHRIMQISQFLSLGSLKPIFKQVNDKQSGE